MEPHTITETALWTSDKSLDNPFQQDTVLISSKQSFRILFPLTMFHPRCPLGSETSKTPLEKLDAKLLFSTLYKEKRKCCCLYFQYHAVQLARMLKCTEFTVTFLETFSTFAHLT